LNNHDKANNYVNFIIIIIIIIIVVVVIILQIAAASRIPGVTPAALVQLLRYVKKL